MEKIKERMFSIIIVTINFMFFLKLIKESFKIQDFDYILVLLLMMFGILIYLFYTFILDKKSYKLIFTISLLTIIAILLYKYKEVVSDYLLKDFVSNVLDINNALLKEKSTYFYQYKKILFIVIPFLVSLLIILTNIWKNSVILFNFISMISLWYSILFNSVMNNIYYFLGVSLITFAINSFQKKIREFEMQEIKVNLKTKQILLYSFVITLIIVRITSILPQNYSGQNITELTDTFQNRFAPKRGIGNLKNALVGEFDLNQSGYNDTEVKLGGPITLDRKEVFRVRSDKPYYLKGTVKDYYSKNYWISTEEGPFPKSENYDFKKSGLKSIGEGEVEGVIGATTKEIEIFPTTNLNSTSFFVPNNGFDVTSDYKGVFYTKTPTFMNDVDIRNPYKVKFFSYRGYENYVEGIQNRPGSVSIKAEEYKLPIRDHSEPYLNYKKRVDSLELDNFDKSQLSNVLDNYEAFLQIDTEVSEEVFNLLNTILNTTGKDKSKLTNYEKALAIRNYLTQNYPYTLEVSEIPTDKDFVSYFLLEEKKGYCTYFASATTVLCRIAGIPSRYVQGFKTPDNVDSEGKYIVTNAEAHAWCEILINPEKDLWIVVDPSPTPTEVEALNNTTDKENIDSDLNNNGDTERDAQKPNRRNPMEEELGDEIFHESIYNLNYGLFSSVAILTTIIMYILYRIMKFRRRIRYICRSVSIIPLYEYFMDRLDTIYISKPESSGDLEFISTIRDSELKKILTEIANLSYEEFYGGIIRNNVDKETYIKFIEDYLRENDNKIAYEMKKYFGFN